MEETATRELFLRIAEFEDQKAFRELYNSRFARLYRFSFSIVHSKEYAEEIVNDVFMNLWRRRNKLHKITNPDVYLYVAVKNHSLDYLSREHLRNTTDICELGAEHLKFTSDPENLMITAEMTKKLEQVIQQLPPKCKMIFKLVKEDGLKYKEVAAILNLSVKTIEAQLTIATKRITQAIFFNLEERKSSIRQGN